MSDAQKIDELFSNPEALSEVLGRGLQDAIRAHKRAQVPMVVWRDGRVVEIPPDELPDPDAGEPKADAHGSNGHAP